MGRVRVFCATSLDGFLAGEGGDLSWLPQAAPGGDDGGFGAFLAGIGALLVGRRTYDAVVGFDVAWPFGDRPVLVATTRPLTPAAPTVRAARGPVAALVAEARAAAGDRDVYVDGGAVIRQALDADLIDDVTLTLVPVVLGRGVPLFAGAAARRGFAIARAATIPGGMVQLTLARDRGAG